MAGSRTLWCSAVIKQENGGAEKGMALIIVLGLVALIGVWASTAAYEDMLSLRRAENMQDAVRAKQASHSLFALALKLLREDAQDSQLDDLEEGWAQQVASFPIDQGTVGGVIIDANRFLNINDLVNSQGTVQVDVEANVKLLFKRLELDIALVNKLIDWMDRDSVPYGADGAEDSAYYDSPYKVKNGALERWGELRMIRGIDDEVIAKLERFFVVRASPAGGKTPININTASSEVLMALFPQMTDADAQALIDSRPYSGVNLAQQVWAEDTAIQGRLSTMSDLFIVRTDSRFGRAALREEFMVSRQGRDLRLVSREQLEWNRGVQQGVEKL